MQDKITYHWGDRHLQIVLGNRIAPRIKALYWGEFVLTLGMATVFLMQSLPMLTDVIHFVSGIGAAFLYALAAYRFLSRMMYREELWLDDEYMMVVSTTPFKRKVSKYSWDGIGPLHYAGKLMKTDHPLKGQCYDYFGFETQEQLIQNIHDEGNLYFNYEGFAVRFARGVYSWHAEEMVRIMKLFAGNNLRLAPEWKQLMQQTSYDMEGEA
ncbi:hypothetical protein CAP35_08010 [Chitinophagaceae bacterium IBVUCB1]|nr:hypothetical protein CAP35_08010 [Chitinophagaceae bacterium IBVUCB1]